MRFGALAAVIVLLLTFSASVLLFGAEPDAELGRGAPKEAPEEERGPAIVPEDDRFGWCRRPVPCGGATR